MHDFEFDVRQASRNDVRYSYKVTDFSWSILRYNLFNRCKRAYFLNYYLAQGGWDDFANPLARSAYCEKYMTSLDDWVQQTFQNAIVDTIKHICIHPPQERYKIFSRYMLSSFGRMVSDLQQSLKNKEYLDDPKKPVIQEFLQDPKSYPSVDKLTAKVVAMLSNGYGELQKTEFMNEMLSLDFMDFHLEDKFLYINRKNFPVWLSPGIIYIKRDSVYMICFYAYNQRIPAGNRSWDLRCGLFDRYCLEKWNKQNVFNTCFSFSDTDVAVKNKPIPTPDLEKMIDKSSEEMLETISSEGTVYLENFPCCENEETCKSCQFRNTCRMIQKQYC